MGETRRSQALTAVTRDTPYLSIRPCNCSVNRACETPCINDVQTTLTNDSRCAGNDYRKFEDARKTDRETQPARPAPNDSIKQLKSPGLNQVGVGLGTSDRCSPAYSWLSSHHRRIYCELRWLQRPSSPGTQNGNTLQVHLGDQEPDATSTCAPNARAQVQTPTGTETKVAEP